jgi:hypothetical protein
MKISTDLVLSAVIAALTVTSVSAAEQAVPSKPATAATSSPPAGAAWKIGRTPWGDPDIQGSWPISHLMSTPLQRPKQFGNRLEFTPQELEQQRKAVDAQNNRFKEEESQNKISMGHWVEDTGLPAQTSLIVDPIDGQLPAQTEAGKHQSSIMGSDWNRQYFDSVKDFGTWNRCITRGLPNGMLPNPYNNGIQLVQAPGYVVINMEMVHEARIIPLSKLPPIDGAVTQWLGVSRGHWEGNTLVVETTNFNGETSMTDPPTRGSPNDPRASSTQMKITERFERVSKDKLIYTITIHDPVTQVADWTVRAPWKLDDNYDFYEYACHEDNSAVRNYITASRARRAQEAAQKAAAPK